MIAVIFFISLLLVNWRKVSEYWWGFWNWSLKMII